MCGSEYGTAVFTTTDAPAHRPAPIRIRMQGPQLAKSVKLEYGATPALGSEVALACAAGCEAQITAGPNTPLFMRRTYYDTNGQSIAKSSIRAILLQ